MKNDPDKLIKTEIKGREVTYYLTTEGDLQNVKSNSLLGDIFTLIASLTAGGIIAVLLSKATGITIRREVMDLLDILLYVFVVFTIILGCFAIHFFCKSFKIIQEIKGSGAIKSIESVTQEEATETVKTEKAPTKKAPGLEIIQAVYWTPKVKLEVTEELKSMVVNGRLETTASNEIKGDPEVGVVKKLRIAYAFNGKTITKEFTEGDKIRIP
jgi:hypothetical protein